MAADHENREKMFLTLCFNSRYLKKARTKLDGSKPKSSIWGSTGREEDEILYQLSIPHNKPTLDSLV